MRFIHYPLPYWIIQAVFMLALITTNMCKIGRAVLEPNPLASWIDVQCVLLPIFAFISPMAPILYYENHERAVMQPNHSRPGLGSVPISKYFADRVIVTRILC